MFLVEVIRIHISRLLHDVVMLEVAIFDEENKNFIRPCCSVIGSLFRFINFDEAIWIAFFVVPVFFLQLFSKLFFLFR